MKTGKSKNAREASRLLIKNFNQWKLLEMPNYLNLKAMSFLINQIVLRLDKGKQILAEIECSKENCKRKLSKPLKP